MSRLDPDHWPAWTPPYLLSPNAAPEQLAADASHGGRVDQLPAYAQGKLDEQYPPDPRVFAIVRQFRDVREAVRRLAGMDDDAARRRIARPGGRGSAGHVEPPHRPVDHGRRDTPPAPTDRPRTCRGGSGRTAGSTTSRLPPTRRRRPPPGCFTRPGPAQALAAAVLRDHAVHDDDARWQITARSDLVRLAARLGADVRLGIHLSEALGREIERRAGDPAAVLDLRRKFPARPE